SCRTAFLPDGRRWFVGSLDRLDQVDVENLEPVPGQDHDGRALPRVGDRLGVGHRDLATPGCLEPIGPEGPRVDHLEELVVSHFPPPFGVCFARYSITIWRAMNATLVLCSAASFRRVFTRPLPRSGTRPPISATIPRSRAMPSRTRRIPSRPRSTSRLSRTGQT